MPPPKGKASERIAVPNPLALDPLIHPSGLDTNDLPADWRELGRRVLGEALRRSMRELRRRNGCDAGSGRFHAKREGHS